MHFFYLLALLPLIVGFFIWYNNQEVNWIEWLAASAVAFLLAGIFHALAIHGMTRDVETWSGYITSARQFSAWREYYEEAIYRTECHTVCTGSGKNRECHEECHQVFDHWESRRRWHDAYWEAYSNISTTYRISQDKYKYFVKQFGQQSTIKGDRTTFEHNSKMIDGDPNDYTTDRVSGWIEPVNVTKEWTNRIKASPSVFSFITVPKDIPVFPYPNNDDPWQSRRLLGQAAKHFNIFKFDQMNARLGASKRVNVIIVGFDSDDSMLAEYQRAKWIGGKKNDVVLCYGRNWTRVFGWTDSEVCKQNLQELLLQHPKNDDLLPLIEGEIRQNYVLKDWKQFDYITIKPKFGFVVAYFICLIIAETALYAFFIQNDYNKTNTRELVYH